MTLTEDPTVVEAAPEEESNLFKEMPPSVATVVWSFILFCAVVVPAARHQAHTLHAFRPVVFLNGTLIVCVVAACAFAVARIVGKPNTTAIRVAAVTVFGVFWWALLGTVVFNVARAVYGLLPGNGEPNFGVWVEAFAIPILSIALILAMVKVGKTWTAGLTIAFLFLAVAGAYGVALMGERIEAQPEGAIVASVGSPADTPNLVVILLDGKPRSDVQAELFSIDDTAIRAELDDLGFTTNLDLWSNANRTYASLAAMMSLDTPVTEETPAASVWPRVRGVTGGDGEFFRAFKAAGYSVSMSTPGWNGSRCDSIVDRCDLFRQTDSNLYWLLRASVIGSVVPDFIRAPWVNIGDAQLDNIAAMHEANLSGEGPSVTWIHTDLPHPPVSFSRDCTYNNEPWRRIFALTDGSEDDAKQIEAMAEQIECVDNRVVEQVSQIVAADPTVAILIVSDHGTDSQLQDVTQISTFDDRQIWERMAAFGTFRGPERCASVSSQPTVVETFREITRCLLDAEVSDATVGIYLVPSEVGVSRAEAIYQVHPVNP
ncbi:MAG: hypothetical protein ACR2N2_12315 [Acidimicrobiia bacterium]